MPGGVRRGPYTPPARHEAKSARVRRSRALAGRRSAVLHHLLVEHFAVSVSTLLEREPEAVPGHEGPLARHVEAAGRFPAHGEAGIVETWLALPAPATAASSSPPRTPCRRPG
ncbi:hypothetical protein ACWF9B_09875 [Streptomyces sp. NPDC055089]